MKVSLVTTIEQFKPFEASYDALLQKVGGIESLYYSRPQIRLSLETFKELGATLFFLFVHEKGQLVAVLPFQLVKDAAFDLRRTIRFWGELDIYYHNTHQHMLADGYQPDAIDAAASFLQSDLKKMWDTIWFDLAKEKDENIQYFISRFPCVRVRPSEEKYYYFSADHDLDKHLGPKLGREIRRCRRRLTEDFDQIDLVIKEVIEPSDMEEIRTLHSARQQYKNNGGDFFNDSLENLYITNLVELWNEQKNTHYYALRADGRLIAFKIMLKAEDVTYDFIMAFDNDFSKYAPSRMLGYDAFHHELDHHGVRRIELSRGANRHKENYSTDGDRLFDVWISNDSFRSRSVRSAIHIIFRLRRKLSILNVLLGKLKKSGESDAS